MLNPASLADVAVRTDVAEPIDVAEPTVVRSRMGTWLGGAYMPVPRSHAKELAGPVGASAQPVAAVVFVRPRPQGSTKAALLGTGSQAALLAKVAEQQHISKVNYAHTTRIAALKGCGALGPHPARDPV
jgi:hypothetical protein